MSRVLRVVCGTPPHDFKTLDEAAEWLRQDQARMEKEMQALRNERDAGQLAILEREVYELMQH